jgi:phenylalanyl-tRNA synthetase beta chain
MQISLKWVNELVNIETVNLDYLIEKLTLGGFEVEDILEIKLNNQKIITLDISATANRSDSLSIQGISKEISALLNKPSKPFKYFNNNFGWKEQINNVSSPILTNTDVSIFTAVTLENIKNVTTPKWLQEKLISSGLTIENNLLDFKNYILLETGYPFEFYDLEKINSKLTNNSFDLTITPGNNNKFIASNDIEYKIDNSILLVKANNLPLSIAGIVPNKEFCYSNSTTSLLIEGSIFNSTQIRQQSRKLGLRTDRSARYEKSLKNINLLDSLYRLISLLKISNPNLTCKLHTINELKKTSLKPIILNYKTLNEILGPVKVYNNTNFIYISTRIVSNYLTRLNFNYRYDDQKKFWEVQIPYSRSEDITLEIDLVEEIGRLHGFNNFLTRLPTIKKVGIADYSYQTRKKITSCLLNLGLTEFIHYSLVPEKTFSNNEVKLINPSLFDYSNLRSSLLPNLIMTVSQNLKQGNLAPEGFEYGHVFSGNILTKLSERENIAGIFGGTKIKRKWSKPSMALNWFEGKGKVEQLFKQLNVITNWKPYSFSTTNELFHPYRTAEITLLNNVSLGIFGQINPILAKKLNLSTELYLFEFNFDIIQKTIKKNNLINYQEYSLYPKVIKDLSFIIHQDISFDEIKTALFLNGSKFLIQINLLDEYRGTGIPDNHLSLCLQLIFQSDQKTLQNKELEKIINHLQLLLIEKFKVRIRD